MRTPIAAATVASIVVTFASASTAAGLLVRSAGIGAQTEQALLAHGGLHTAGGTAPGFPESWGLSHRDVVDIGAGLFIAVLLFVVLVLRVHRRRRASTAGAPDAQQRAFPQTAESWRGSGLAVDSTGPLPPFQANLTMVPTLTQGWHPVRGDPSKLAYWDGATWAAFRQWDGQQWIDPVTIPT